MKRGHGEKLSRKKEAAVAALLTHGTVELAAQAVGVAASTLKRWLTLAEFRADFHQARADALQAAVARLQADGFKAALVLAKLLDDADPNVKARAATAILDRGMRGAELLDLQRDLGELKESIRGLIANGRGDAAGAGGQAAGGGHGLNGSGRVPRPGQAAG